MPIKTTHVVEHGQTEFALTAVFELTIELIDGTVEVKGADPCSPKCSLQGDNYWHRQLNPYEHITPDHPPTQILTV